MKRGKREKTFWNIAGNVVTKRQKGVFSRSVTGDVSEKNRPIDPRSKWQRDGGCLVPDVISVADRESSIFTSSRGRIDVTRRDSLPRSFLPFFPLISLFFLFCDTVIRDILFFSPDFQTSLLQFSSWTIFLDRAGLARFSTQH